METEISTSFDLAPQPILAGQHTKTNRIVLLALVLWAAFPADAQPASLATSDTEIQVEAADNKLKLSILKSARMNWNWVAGSEMPFINSAEVNEKTLPLSWKFKRLNDSVDSQRQVSQQMFVFENEHPALELNSIWTAHSGHGPVEHQITIRNRGNISVVLPLQPTIVFDARAPRGHFLENIWVEKGAGKPSAIGTHRTKVEKGFSANLISTPYNDEPRDAIPWTAIQDITGQQGWYAGIEFSGRVQIALRVIMDGA